MNRPPILVLAVFLVASSCRATDEGAALPVASEDPGGVSEKDVEAALNDPENACKGDREATKALLENYFTLQQPIEATLFVELSVDPVRVEQLSGIVERLAGVVCGPDSEKVEILLGCKGLQDTQKNRCSLMDEAYQELAELAGTFCELGLFADDVSPVHDEGAARKAAAETFLAGLQAQGAVPESLSPTQKEQVLARILQLVDQAMKYTETELNQLAENEKQGAQNIRKLVQKFRNDCAVAIYQMQANWHCKKEQCRDDLDDDTEERGERGDGEEETDGGPTAPEDGDDEATGAPDGGTSAR